MDINNINNTVRFFTTKLYFCIIFAHNVNIITSVTKKQYFYTGNIIIFISITIITLLLILAVVVVVVLFFSDFAVLCYSIKFLVVVEKTFDPEAVTAATHVFLLQQHVQLRVEMSVEMVELSVKAPEPVRPTGILQQNRVFLDFFWDLAKPDQEVRLKAVENLIQYLKTNNKVRQSVNSAWFSLYRN